MFITFRLRKLSIRNVHPWKVYREKRLNIDQIEILHPEITLVNKQHEFNENKPPRPEPLALRLYFQVPEVNYGLTASTLEISVLNMSTETIAVPVSRFA